MHYERKLDFPDDWFEQETAFCKDNGKYYPAVKFKISANVWWKRFIGYSGNHKANFLGAYKGMNWSPPGMKVNEGDQIWITEGIFNAGSLYQNGIKAIACLSCNNIPTKFIETHKEMGIIWVLGLDNDPINKNTGKNAGLEATKNFRRHLIDLGENVKITFTHTNKDWNDIHRKDGINEETIEKSFWRGKLMTAKNEVARNRNSDPIVEIFWREYKHHLRDLSSLLLQ